MVRVYFKVGPDIVDDRHIENVPRVGEFVVAGGCFHEVVTVTYIYTPYNPACINVGMRPTSMDVSKGMEAKLEGEG